MVSFNQPFGDFFYTVCFVSTLMHSDEDQKWCVDKSVYFSTAYIMIMFVFRMIQSAKLFRQITMQRPDKKYDFMVAPFLGFFRALLSLTTAGIALINR